ncbi:MAG: SRPBCC family protein [Actinomycetota bacterium]|nr:SRPBCC family protein [Actinomycetota bacterium]
MTDVERSIEVDVPISTCYNQWTQFEEFPHFMEGVRSVTQIDDTHIKWSAEIAGQTREWLSEITEQKPDERIAWTSREGATNAGVVTFHRISDSRTKVMLQLEFEPEGVVEQVGDKLGLVKMRADGDLKRFKEFIEERGRETGEWRGEVDRSEGTSGPPTDIDITEQTAPR